jgi:hypothetical protein
MHSHVIWIIHLHLNITYSESWKFISQPLRKRHTARYKFGILKPKAFICTEMNLTNTSLGIFAIYLLLPPRYWSACHIKTSPKNTTSIGGVATQALVAGFPLRWPEFEPGSSNVGCMVDRATLGEVSSEYFGFSCHSFILLIPPQSSPSDNHGWYDRPINDSNNSGLFSTSTPIQTNKLRGL